MHEHACIGSLSRGDNRPPAPRSLTHSLTHERAAPAGSTSRSARARFIVLSEQGEEEALAELHQYSVAASDVLLQVNRARAAGANGFALFLFKEVADEALDAAVYAALD